MKFNTSMPHKLKSYFEKELDQYHDHFTQQRYGAAWVFLERAHILGQNYPYEHSLVHWKMLLFGIKIKSLKEVIGQVPRLVFGGLKSFVGKVPIGNPGGANVPPLKPFEIEDDLKAIFKKLELGN